MKKYRVCCTRTVREEWLVEANSKEEAERLVENDDESIELFDTSSSEDPTDIEVVEELN